MAILNRKHKTDENDNEEKTEHTGASHEYFHGHECHLPADKLSAYSYIGGKGFGKWFFRMITVTASDIRAINLYRSYAALCAEKFRHRKEFPCSIHPYSRLRFYLEVIFVFVLLVQSLSLAIHYSGEDPANHPYEELVIISDFMVIINIIANFFTGYVEGLSRKVAVLSLSKIAWRYLKTWFLIDLLASTVFFVDLYTLDNVRVLLSLEITKLLRLPVIYTYLDNILTVKKSSVYQKTAIETLFFLLMYISWNIYFQFAVDYMVEGSYHPEHPSNCSWLSLGKLWDEKGSIRLLYAFDRAVSMLTTNTNLNLLEQKGCFENFLVVCWLASKIFVFHFALKYILALFGRESARANYYMMKRQLEIYMVQKNFPPRLKKKILKFYAIRFQSKYFEESHMLACVSGQLREDILMHTGRQLVRELEFLKQLPSSLLVQIAFKLRVVIYIAGDIIYKINTIGDCLYFIDRGTVAVYSDSAKEICHLEDGDFFGEIALVMKHHFRTTSVIAVTNCELFRLDREDFNSTIAHYPTVYDNIKEVATSRFERTCVLDEHHKAELKTNAQYDSP
ncbi:potassium/sodium hyperpolarization-activated cyclic nucleotide-gated channel 3-like [Trichoplusia ni]|uniref:Potassium/sodium hyperpolarization-activated cyclic nucleotide-gated channel 3-like n=1 Tax=Trichoplusia ni TaxID=7111 RepID=A0A7E5W2K9_TRINI|nr:potassium/sodium hyperpolarization-activated cyclic nucleotide-gated channel 3-like [Trichoplusia ni]